jgi:prevent-host-death family protein
MDIMPLRFTRSRIDGVPCAVCPSAVEIESGGRELLPRSLGDRPEMSGARRPDDVPWRNCPMMRLNVVELRQSLAEILNRAEYQGERIIIHRRGKDAAAIIPIEDLKLLERLIEDAEDCLDVEAARAALAESDDRIPYVEVRRRLGLDDEQETKRIGAKVRAETV